MLILLPNILYEEGWKDLPLGLKEEIEKIDLLLAESEKSARQYLKHFGKTLPIEVYNKHTTKQDFDFFLSEMRSKVLGLISDAGLAAVADPGSDLVALCHKNKIPVKALSGPSSITFALMLSGFSGNAFSFYGYLPKKEKERISFVKQLEKRSEQQGSSEIFIETPYRSEKLFLFLLDHLKGDTELFLGRNLSSSSQFAQSKKVRLWKKERLSWDKSPSIFILSRKRFFSSQS